MQKHDFEVKISTQMYLETQGLPYPSKNLSSKPNPTNGVNTLFVGFFYAL